VGKAVEHAWNAIGLTPARDANPQSLGAAATSTLQAYASGADVEAELPQHTKSRHSSQILLSEGVDIALPFGKRRFSMQKLEKQISYENRWKPTQQLLNTALAGKTAQEALKDFELGLDFLRDGVVPVGMTHKDTERWLSRWRSFAASCGALRVDGPIIEDDVPQEKVELRPRVSIQDVPEEEAPLPLAKGL